MAVIFLMGPTATGKTDIAVELTQKFPLEIISVDSAMVYKGMDIGTAKPDADILAKAPHRLVDICEPTESYSAAQFRTDALNEIKQIQAKNKIPLLVGGTGLYFKSLSEGLSMLPGADTSIRQQLDQDYREQGLAVLYKRLTEIDPESAARIDANDPQRIQRALEVYEITGKPMSELLNSRQNQALSDDIIKILLMPECRQTHRDICKKRFIQMLDAGLINEVENLFHRDDLNSTMPSMRLVGYRQVWRYLESQLDYDEMQKHAIIATRQLAKRQMTWFRKEQNAITINSQDEQKWHKVVESLIQHPKLQNFG